MCYTNNSAVILLQGCLEPLYRLGIEMVGGLVEQQNIRLLQKKPAEGNPSSLPSRENAYIRSAVGTSECIHCPFELMIDVPSVGIVDLLLEHCLAVHQLLHPVRILIDLRLPEFLIYRFILRNKVHCFPDSLLNDLPHGTAVVKKRILGQMTHGVTRNESNFALVFCFNTGNYFQKGGFP